MVRKAGSDIAVLGPYYTDQVRMMVEQGMLDADDEICPENSYWFAVREVAEVKKQLGLENVPLRREQDDELTQPDLEATTDPAFDVQNTGMIKINRQAPQAAVRSTTTPKTITTPPMSAAELATRFERVNTSQFLGYGGGSRPQVMGIEKGRFWSLLFFICVTLAALGVVWVLKSLRV